MATLPGTLGDMSGGAYMRRWQRLLIPQWARVCVAIYFPIHIVLNGAGVWLILEVARTIGG